MTAATRRTASGLRRRRCCVTRFTPGSLFDRTAFVGLNPARESIEVSSATASRARSDAEGSSIPRSTLEIVSGVVSAASASAAWVSYVSGRGHLGAFSSNATVGAENRHRQDVSA